jgi:Ca2+-binding EF-hand superfamily protein
MTVAELQVGSEAIFRQFDGDNSGSLGIDELVEIYEELGSQKTRAELQELVDRIDEDGSGKIELDEFQALVEDLRVELQFQGFEKQCRGAFSILDSANTGAIT